MLGPLDGHLGAALAMGALKTEDDLLGGLRLEKEENI